MKQRRDNWYQSSIGNSGTIAENVACPVCGERIIYNGNYFCKDWGYTDHGKRHGGTCNWALPHPVVKDSDKFICDILGIDHD